MKILAVDDDELILEVLVEAMAAGGYTEVATAGSAAEACRRIAEASTPFDCFLLDIQMPEVTGIELCARIRQMPEYAKTPIIMVTAMSERNYVTAAFAAGATDYVTKPFDALELGTRVGMAERLVEEARQARLQLDAAAGLRAEIEAQARVDFDAPLTIEGIDGVIGLVSLENYLLQLSRGGLFATNIFAVRLENAARLHARTSAADYRFLLADAAEAIAIAASTREFFVSYAGSGVFIVLIHGREIEERDYFEDVANVALYEMDPTDSHGRRLDMRLHFGTAMRVGMMRSGPSAVDAIYAAIDRLDQAERPGVAPRKAARSPWLKMLVG